MRAVAVIMSKAPIPGFTKTRLASGFSPVERALIHKACLADTVNACVDQGIRTEIHFTGGTKEDFARPLLDADRSEAEAHRAIGRAASFVPQSEGDLGARMRGAFELALGAFDAAIVVGADIPGIDGAILRDAIDRISSRDLVLGPAPDGGYYLIALKKPTPRLFDDIVWSRDDVAQRTIAKAAGLGLSVAMTEPRRDIDTPDDARAFLADAERDLRLRRGLAWERLSKTTKRKDA